MISLPNRRTLLALLALVLLTLTVVSCKNFFVDPKLTSLVITAAQPSVAVGVTDQLQAVGTYDDSSTKDLSSSVTWTPSPAGVVTTAPALTPDMETETETMTEAEIQHTPAVYSADRWAVPPHCWPPR